MEIDFETFKKEVLPILVDHDAKTAETNLMWLWENIPRPKKDRLAWYCLNLKRLMGLI